MRWIRKSVPPASFQEYIKAENADFDEIDDKEGLRASLVNEQKGVCAYCQQILKEGKIKLEHHCERSICNGKEGKPDRRLDFKNLLAVCLGVGGIKADRHCDTRKSDFKESEDDLLITQKPTSKKVLPITLNPTIPAHIATIHYKSSGKLVSTNDQYQEELNRVLALNVQHLKEARRNKWITIYKNSKDKKGKFNKEKMRRLIKKDLDTLDEKGHFKNNFPGLSEYMLAKFCKS